MTNLQSIFNKLNVNLFVARRDAGEALARVENLDLESDLFDALSKLEYCIEEALDSLRKCREEFPKDALSKYRV